ncbi:MAG TPA: hypothetical protein VIL85_27820 [Thermomicrobiales bacterium]
MTPQRYTQWFPTLGKGLATLGLAFTLVACGTPVATETTGSLIAPSPTATATIAPTATIPPTATLAPTPTIPATATIPPTATPAATATTAKTPTRALTPTVAATRAATTPTARPALSPTAPPAAGANIVRDEDGRCQLTLIPGYTVDSAGDGFDADDANGLGVLSSAAGRSETPEALAQSLYSGFTSVLTNVQQGKTTSNAATSQIDFTGTLASNSGKGTVYIKKFGTTVCGVSIFTYDKAQIPHEIVATSILLTVKENK